MNSRQISVVAFIGSVILAGALFAKRGGKSSESSAAEIIAAERLPAVAGQPQVAAPSGSAGASAEKSKGMVLAKGTFKFRAELEEYGRLKSKVFQSDDDKNRRAGLVSDRDLLASLELLLLSPAKTGSDLEILQNEALDLLFEAQETASADAANRVLRSVVSDAQVEDSALDMDARRSLGGVKAEVLFNWSARDPRMVSDLKAWLPGSVSGRIWDNVQQAQRRNRMESSAEID